MKTKFILTLIAVLVLFQPATAQENDRKIQGYLVIPVDIRTYLGQGEAEMKPPREKRSNVFLSYNMGVYPYLSYGVNVGWVGTYAGVYAKARSNFKFAKDVCFCDGTMADGTELWTNGKKSYSRTSATLGAMFRITDNVFPYVGTGYGVSNVLWGDYSGKWLTVKDYQVKGISADLGVMFQFKHIVLSAGVTTTAFKYYECEIGIGYMF